MSTIHWKTKELPRKVATIHRVAVCYDSVARSKVRSLVVGKANYIVCAVFTESIDVLWLRKGIK